VRTTDLLTSVTIYQSLQAEISAFPPDTFAKHGWSPLVYTWCQLSNILQMLPLVTLPLGGRQRTTSDKNHSGMNMANAHENLKTLHSHAFYPFNNPCVLKGEIVTPSFKGNKLLSPYATFGYCSSGSFLVGSELAQERGQSSISPAVTNRVPVTSSPLGNSLYRLLFIRCY
jgi:hypothetical protein